MNFFRQKGKLINLYLVSLIFLGLFLNLWVHRFYDQSWSVGEWLINYSGGFVRRGLIGSLIYNFSLITNINPIIFVQFISVISFLIFLVLLKNCRKYFSTTFLLSPIVTLSPIFGQTLIRKDLFQIAMYGLCTLIILKKRSLDSFLLLNSIAIISILNHESFIFFALPSMFILHIFNDFKIQKKTNLLFLIRRALFFLSPCFAVSGIIFLFKGTPEQALDIHYSWQNLINILPTKGMLLEAKPSGAILSIGRDFSYSAELLWKTTFGENSFSGFVYIPIVWLITIFVVAQIFIGDGYQETRRIKVNVLIVQFISISPLFIFGWDYGRWIFLWISSSIFFTSALMKVFNSDTFLLSRFVNFSLLPIFSRINGFNLQGKWQIIYLIISIPPCCWTFNKYFSTIPIFYPFVIFYKAIDRILL